jgi:8-oxo-dGTP diphosphatase
MDKILQNQLTIVVAVIQNENGDILLAKRNEPELEHAHGKWEFVGGGIEFGESPEEALKREVKEEAGIEVEVVKVLPKIFSEMLNEQTQVIILSYECRITGGELKAGLDQEIAELKFVPLVEVKNYNSFNNIQKTVDLLIN